LPPGFCFGYVSSASAPGKGDIDDGASDAELSIVLLSRADAMLSLR